MKEIKVNARLRIMPGKMDEFKKLGHACVEMVKQKDKGTLQYDWFYNEGKSECIVREHYVNSEAALEHISNVGELLGGLVAISEISLEVYGSPSQTLLDALQGFDVLYYEYGVGLATI